MPSLLWFRRDLRLHDLPALAAAIDQDRDVLACFVLDPRLEASSGPRRLQFLGDCLRHLNAELDGRLLITRGRPEERIPLIANKVDATAVHISADFSPFGRRRDSRVQDALDGIPLISTGSPYLISPGRVTKDDDSPYKVFTPFFRRWRDHGWRQPAGTGAQSARWIDPGSVATAVSKLADAPDTGVPAGFTAGEEAARHRWQQFVDEGLGDYDDHRDLPGIDGTSHMSVHLKFGTIHPRTMVADLDLRHSSHLAYLRQLAFRDFYAAVLHHWPNSAWHNWNRDFDVIETDTDDAAERLFEAWKAGQTGFPFVDAGMRQLHQTGFMPNRVRMIAASFLVKDLHLPWQWGARWFMEQLVDADIANNQHGWQWCAGSGTDAAPYFRVFNPTAQGQKFDPTGAYIRRWIPELADVVDPHLKSGSRPADYPAAIVDHGEERGEALRRYQAVGARSAAVRASRKP
ncbi:MULTISPECIES: deoxyribodipyrimidine photo-lyase [unclassified Mycolicibacterium]|uniref:cryptochrome/photolyase family protein n=1 Tax=Mycobacteriaceae TaxID=1762 RepID=UPI000EB92ECD|nr:MULTISPECIES: deoxyribodipyrimidine photo-lyase [unclassified Mycolicibacterium]BCI80777.1 deoxyribodipyrimidine photo-lyase [Mycolicibacterium sp. TY66]BCJ81562.1 deoxyribodipyrimidine photo-lyase [Mycolicibacterium sp. TY81]GCB00567.1 deoxyribodipyrimidine photo-lyase [Mycolicibacterium sp. NCC-Tsukiji]